MKRYKLKKDLPTFNTGDVFELTGHGLCLVERDGKPLEHNAKITAYCKATLQKFPGILDSNKWFEEIPEKPKTVWDLEHGDECFILTSGANIVYPAGTMWCKGYEKDRAVGDIFLTEEECWKEIKRREAKQTILRDTKGFKPDWGDENQQKWYVYYNFSEERFDADAVWRQKFAPDEIYFSTYRDAMDSVSEHREEWKTYLCVEK